MNRAIREFCDKNNGYLLVKCRKKDPAKRYLAKIADKVLYDESAGDFNYSLDYSKSILSKVQEFENKVKEREKNEQSQGNLEESR